MPNELVLFIEVLVVFSSLLLTKKFFGKIGVMAWVCLATVLANLITAKNAEIFGLPCAIGSVMFASTFLATDILTECYGARDAKKAVLMGLGSTILFVLATQIALLYTPSAIDYAEDSMRNLFSLNLQISISSAVMYFVANIADIYIFEAIRKKTNGKYLWLRNNVATILCNCLENFFFVGFAFLGVFSFTDIMLTALSVSLIEAIVGICDTPFLYIARRIKERVNDHSNQGGLENNQG